MYEYKSQQKLDTSAPVIPSTHLFEESFGLRGLWVRAAERRWDVKIVRRLIRAVLPLKILSASKTCSRVKRQTWPGRGGGEWGPECSVSSFFPHLKPVYTFCHRRRILVRHRQSLTLCQWKRTSGQADCAQNQFSLSNGPSPFTQCKIDEYRHSDGRYKQVLIVDEIWFNLKGKTLYSVEADLTTGQKILTK